MAEPTVVCPQCKTEIKLTESLAAPLLESVRRDYEQRLSQKDADVTRREQALADRAHDHRKLRRHNLGRESPARRGILLHAAVGRCKRVIFAMRSQITLLTASLVTNCV